MRKGATVAALVTLAWPLAAQDARVGGGTTRFGLHAYDWKLHVVESDGSLSDPAMASRNHGHLDLDVWSCNWTIRAGNHAAEIFMMDCTATATRVGMTSAIGCSRAKPDNLARWIFGFPQAASSSFTAKCSETTNGVTWTKTVGGPPASVLRNAAGTAGSADLGIWSCNWAQQRGGAQSLEDLFKVECSTLGTGPTTASLTVAAWCDDATKPADAVTWNFQHTGAVGFNQSKTNRVTVSCSGTPPATSVASARASSSRPANSASDNPY